MNSDAIGRLSAIYSDEYEQRMASTEYKGIELKEMIEYLSKTSWKDEFAKFQRRNEKILEIRGFGDDLGPAWYLARLFTGGPPSVAQVTEVYKNSQ